MMKSKHLSLILHSSLTRIGSYAVMTQNLLESFSPGEIKKKGNGMTSLHGIHVLHNAQACSGIWFNVKDGNQSNIQKWKT